MDSFEAFAIVVHEGIAEDGMVIQTRAGIDPGQARVRRLRDALAILADGPATADKTIDRRLANALHGLSFHMSDTIGSWLSCDWISEYTEILLHVEAIFAGQTNNSM